MKGLMIWNMPKKGGVLTIIYSFNLEPYYAKVSRRIGPSCGDEGLKGLPKILTYQSQFSNLLNYYAFCF